MSSRAIIIFILLISKVLLSQNKFEIYITDSESREPVEGVSVRIGPGVIATSDSAGYVVFPSIGVGSYVITFRHPGYERDSISITLPGTQTPIEVSLIRLEEETEEITVSTTRISRSIEDEPTRVETVSQEEVEEKSNMRPSDVVMLLHESTGIQMQQNSASTANSNIKMQGLQGRYTQLLKDGFPLYSGFSEGLGVMQIVPVDIKQLEIIKGPSSTLYGGGAISGVVNFITRLPGEKTLLSSMLNLNSHKEIDGAVFYSTPKRRYVVSLTGNITLKQAVDVDKDDFTEIPRTISIYLNPKYYFYPDEKTEISISGSGNYFENIGGDITLIDKGKAFPHTYFEKNISRRYTGAGTFRRMTGKSSLINAKGSLSYFDRSIGQQDYYFNGKQFSSFTELNYIIDKGTSSFVFGLNANADKFTDLTSPLPLDYNYVTGGLFAQSGYQFTKYLTLEAGLRTDYHNKFGLFVLPRLSAVLKANENITMRFSGGLGYKAPSVYTEETELAAFRNVLPLSDSLTAEKSLGGTSDINLRFELGSGWLLTLNNMFFYTRINSPVETVSDSTFISIRNSNGYLESKGLEANLRLVNEPFKLFTGYTFTEVFEKGTIRRFLPLVPKHKLGIIALYEKHHNLRFGIEAYFTGKQYLSTGVLTQSTWDVGLMAQKYFGNFSFYINFENILNERQSDYGQVVIPPHNYPEFSEIWTHTEGFYVNGGIRFQLGE